MSEIMGLELVIRHRGNGDERVRGRKGCGGDEWGWRMGVASGWITIM